VDRCALFVDAGYALADGAMAVHGTRRRDSVSWDHAGLLKLLTGLARDRTGLPVLRCYWYEAAADGNRTAEHDALADTPGLKLRLVNVRPGRREGIETQLRRDLLTLAKNGAISDAFVASANENLAEIVAEVQDLGLRVVILHIASDGGWTVPQSLRQESDDLVEISGVHLRPFVDLIRGAEPANSDELYASAAAGSRGHAGGGAPVTGAGTSQGLAVAALPAPGTVYAGSAVADYRQGAQPYSDAGLAQPGSQTAYPGGGGDSQPVGQPGQLGQQQSGQQQNGPAHGGSMPGRSQQNGYSGSAQGAAAQNGSQQSGYPVGAAQAGLPADSYQGGMGQNGMSQNSAAQNGMAQNGMAQNGMAQNGAAYSGSAHGQPAAPAGQGGAGQAGPGQTGAGQAGAGQMPASSAHAGAGLSLQGSGAPGNSAPGSGVPGGSAHGSGGPGSTGPQHAAPQHGAPQGGTPQGGYSGAAMQGSAAQPGMPSSGYQTGSVQNGSMQGSYASGLGQGQNTPAPNGPPQNGYAPGGGQQASYQNGWPQIGPPQGGYQQGPPQNGAQPGDLYGGSYGAAPPAAAQVGFDAAPTPGQHQLYGPPDPGYFSDQPGATGADQGPRASYAQPQPGPAAGTAFPGQAGYPPQPQPVAQLPAVRAMQSVAVSLPEAVKAAHAEGFGFGESVGRDAPALWLDAVLARKPRMPSDLEARLLQGSALPIDSLLHDEVRHSLRRGFWDALESARR